MTLTHPPQPTLIVGRERDQATLAGLLGDAQAGRGSVVLIGGEAGIGKTALLRALGDDAGGQGFLVLTGACYDAGATPPYGPWLELAAGALQRAGTAGWNPEALAQAPTAEAFEAQLRAFLTSLAAQSPLLLILEDLHWADPESLAFLRVVARDAGALPLLLAVSYRDDALRLNPPLDRLLPQLVREARAERISLAPLDAGSVQRLVERRYALTGADLARLTDHLTGRGQGLPLYVLELLRSLEEERRLRPGEDGWTLGEIDPSRVPVLVRQVIDVRLARLSAEVRRLLELAAVIGQDVPLFLWRRVSGAADELFDETVERAIEAHVLEETPSGLQLRFSHALMRDALYAGMSLPQRQRWHRRVAEALAAEADAEPETVAHHFRQALDPRAVEWFIRAGSRAERVAWLTAAGHFARALEMMGTGEPASAERGWLILRRAILLRIAEPRIALALLDTAAMLAEESDDAVLRAYAKFHRGQTRSVAGEVQTGIADLEVSVVEFARLSPADVARVEELERRSLFLSRIDIEGHLAGVLAAAGRVDEALARTQAIIERADRAPERAWWGRAIAMALLGRVSEAREAYAIAREAALRDSDLSSVVIMYLYQISNVEIPYGADNLAERSRIAREGEAAWRRLGLAHGDVSPRIAWLPILQIEGEWAEARTLALSGIRLSDASSERDLTSAVILAQLAWAQGDAALAWELVYALLPSGPQSIPGDMDLGHGLALMRVAVGLCLEREDLTAAQAWLDTHDRWLAWSGAVLGRADGQNAWAGYVLAAGDYSRARQHATQALALASDPRQPLALLEAHRLLGRIEAHAGRISEARDHLLAALELADACAAPYERALGLLAWADLQLRAGAPEQAGLALDEARAICERLGATPALARIESLGARLGEQTAAAERFAPAGLSPREIDVLRLLAAGRSNREIAETLFLSPRTVERHITNLYAKIGAEGRSEAIAFAHLHALI